MNIVSKPAEDVDLVAETMPFTARDILVSASDERGVITFAGQAFCRVSGYDADEALGAPHRIIRHSDMPKGIFHLFWDKLKAGKPVAAYLKNRAKSGMEYWVFAIVTRVPDGYLSVRIKPSSEHLAMIEEVYASLCDHESAGMTGDQSADMLRSALRDRGFASYHAFSEVALDAEFRARGRALGYGGDIFDDIYELADSVEALGALAKDIVSGFAKVRGEPVNLRILAGRLDGAGAALASISQNYDTMASEVFDLIRHLDHDGKGALPDMRQAIVRSRASLQIARLMEQALHGEPEVEAGVGNGLDLLSRHSADLRRSAMATFAHVDATGKRIPEVCRLIRRRINGLDVVKLLCKVESGKIREKDNGLESIIARLEDFHLETAEQLAQLASNALNVSQKSTGIAKRASGDFKAFG